MLAPAKIHFHRLNDCSTSELKKAAAHPSHRRSYEIYDYIEHALAISSVEDLHCFANKVMRDFGYSIFGGGTAILQGSTPTLYCICSGNIEWANYYRRNLLSNDPLIYYCKNNVTPHVWKTNTDISNLKKLSPKMANAIEGFDVKAIVTLPAHGPESLISGFRFAYDREDKLSDEDVLQSLPTLHLINSYLYEAIVRILKLESRKEIHLTNKEKEILSWVAGGLNSYSISAQLKISENTVLFHMKNIHRKLEVNNRHHAVAKALRLNLIDP